MYVVHSTEIPTLRIHANTKQTVVTTYSHRHVRLGFLCLKKPPSVGLQQRIPPAIYESALAYIRADIQGRESDGRLESGGG